GQVERDREGSLPLAQQEAESGVALFRRPVAGELPHRPELAAVHGGVRPAGEWRLARQAKPGLEVILSSGGVRRRVDRGGGEAGGGGEGRRGRVARRGAAGHRPAAWEPAAREPAASSTPATTSGSGVPAGKTAAIPSLRRAS